REILHVLHQQPSLTDVDTRLGQEEAQREACDPSRKGRVRGLEGLTVRTPRLQSLARRTMGQGEGTQAGEDRGGRRGSSRADREGREEGEERSLRWPSARSCC